MCKDIYSPSTAQFITLVKTAGKLDKPDYHDVAFHFPGGQRLYADRFIPQREAASSYFRSLFHTKFGGIPTQHAADSSISEP